MYKPKKLSEIWEKADKDLVQIQGQFGHAGRHQACAMGAIVFYWTNGKTCYPSGLEEPDAENYDKMLIEFSLKTGKTAIDWNDGDQLTFKEFATLARKHDL